VPIRHIVLIVVALAFVPGLASAASEGEQLGTFTKEGERFVGQETAFTLEENLPGIRNLTDRSTGQVLFEEIRLADEGPLDWSVDFDTVTLSATGRPGLLMIQDEAPPTLRAWFAGDRQGKWNLSLADGVSAQPVNENTSELPSSNHDRSYELRVDGEWTTHLLGQETTYDPSQRTFTVRDLSLVYQADRITVEADDGEGCPEEPMCYRFQGFGPTLGAGDEIPLRFENEGSIKHGIWVADEEDVQGPNTSTDDAISGIEEAPSGQAASLNFTVPEGTDGLYLWDARGDHEEQGEFLWWELEGASPSGDFGGAGNRTTTPFTGWIAVLLSSILAAIHRTRRR